MASTKRAEYRQRVVQLADGSIQLIFGNEALPEGKILADHDVSEVITVTDHVVEPGQV